MKREYFFEEMKGIIEGAFGGEFAMMHSNERSKMMHSLETTQGYRLITEYKFGERLNLHSKIEFGPLTIYHDTAIAIGELGENLNDFYRQTVRKLNFALGRETPKTPSEIICERIAEQRKLWDMYRDEFIELFLENRNHLYHKNVVKKLKEDGSFESVEVQGMFEFYIKGVLSVTKNNPAEMAQNAPLVPYFISADTDLPDFIKQVRYAAETGQFDLSLIDSFAFDPENENFIITADQIETERKFPQRSFIGAKYSIEVTFLPYNIKIESRSGSTDKNRSRCHLYLNYALNVIRAVWLETKKELNK